jgi:Reverse transcriptase (RNA-dependent DNA polymerase)
MKGRKPLGNCWAFKKTTEEDVSTLDKARTVMKGYVKIPGVDFTDLFASNATDKPTQVLFALIFTKILSVNRARCGSVKLLMPELLSWKPHC